MEPKVTLMTWTQWPLETVYAVWEASKGEGALVLPSEVPGLVPKDKLEGLFRAVLAQRIPVGEHVDFVFMLENVSVSWREQAVRHRIGVKPSPERVGVDMVMEVIPNLAESSWWSQSMRIQDMGAFASKGAYRVPASLKGKDVELQMFNDTMKIIEDTYNKLVLAGVPMEDARELIPLGAQHRISWKLNLGALQHILRERGCWILQLGLWGPVIKGMVAELVAKVHPIMAELVTPPCLEGDNFKGCIYMEECRRRLEGLDALPPCPLHLNYHKPEATNIYMATEMAARAEEYRHFWNRDPYTGKFNR